MESNKFKLHTENVPGNLHQAASSINRRGLAEFVIAMDCSGSGTVVVFKMPSAMVNRIRKGTKSYIVDACHDDYLG